MKNLEGKTRPVSNPYQTISAGDWTWKVLKHYQSREAELKNLYAMVFCSVTSPFCPQGEMGDVYIKDIPNLTSMLKQSLVAKPQGLPTMQELHES